MKVYEKATRAASSHLMELREYFAEDGVIDPHEERLLESAHRSYAYTEVAGKRQKAGQRVSGGGGIDRNLRREIHDLLVICDQYPEPASISRCAMGATRLEYRKTAKGPIKLVALRGRVRNSRK